MADTPPRRRRSAGGQSAADPGAAEPRAAEPGPVEPAPLERPARRRRPAPDSTAAAGGGSPDGPGEGTEPRQPARRGRPASDDQGSPRRGFGFARDGGADDRGGGGGGGGSDADVAGARERGPGRGPRPGAGGRGGAGSAPRPRGDRPYGQRPDRAPRDGGRQWQPGPRDEGRRDDRGRRDRPWDDRSRGDRPSSAGPWRDRPTREARPWDDRSPRNRSWDDGPPRDRPWDDRPPRRGPDREEPPRGRGRAPDDRPWTDRPPRDRPWQDRRPGGPGEDRPWSARPAPGPARRSSWGADRGAPSGPRERPGSREDARDDRPRRDARDGRRGDLRGDRRRPDRGAGAPWRGERPFDQEGSWRGRPSGPGPGSATPEPDLLADGEELVAGRRPVEEAFVARRPAKRLLVVPQRRQALERLVLHATSLRIPVVEVEGGTLTAIAGFDGHQGIALVVEPRTWATIDEVLARAVERGEPPFVLVLDSLEDPQNVGTLLRSAEAAGVHGVVFPTHRQAPLTPAAIKASAGAVEHLLLCPVDDLPGALSDLHVRGLRIAAAEAEAPLTASQADLRGPLAIVVGSEGQGLAPAVRRRADLGIRIPMRGAIGSLNASVAGSILLFAAVAQRDPIGAMGEATAPPGRDADAAPRLAGADAPPEPGAAAEPVGDDVPPDAGPVESLAAGEDEDRSDEDRTEAPAAGARGSAEVVRSPDDPIEKPKRVSRRRAPAAAEEAPPPSPATPRPRRARAARPASRASSATPPSADGPDGPAVDAGSAGEDDLLPGGPPGS